MQWWTGWTLGATRAALASLDTVEVDLDGQPGLVLTEDEAPVPKAKPWVALLPGLDPTPMGWKERAWYLGEHKPHVFDTRGNVGPTVWMDGRIVGGWAQRKDGSVVTKLLEDVATTRVVHVAKAARKLEDLVRHLPSIPRFPAPLDKELRAEGLLDVTPPLELRFVLSADRLEALPDTPGRGRHRRALQRGQVVAPQRARQPQGPGQDVEDAGTHAAPQLLRGRGRHGAVVDCPGYGYASVSKTRGRVAAA